MSVALAGAALCLLILAGIVWLNWPTAYISDFKITLARFLVYLAVATALVALYVYLLSPYTGEKAGDAIALILSGATLVFSGILTMRVLTNGRWPKPRYKEAGERKDNVIMTVLFLAIAAVALGFALYM